MSTRAYIRIVKEGKESIHFHHHCDGYPSGVGEELRQWLNEYPGEWNPEDVSRYIHNRDASYQFIDNGPKWDHEYVYVVDCDTKRLSCFYKGITSVRDDVNEFNIDSLGDPIEIEPCLFKKESVFCPIEPDVNWEQFRMEAAKDILCEILHDEGVFPYYNDEHDRDRKEQIKDAIMYADELIKQLKESNARKND